MRHWDMFYTKLQLRCVLTAWGFGTDNIPRKGKTVRLKLDGEPFNSATITVHDHKSTYGELLYAVRLEKIDE